MRVARLLSSAAAISVMLAPLGAQSPAPGTARAAGGARPVQTSSTLVSGTITDATGEGIPDVAVVLTQVETATDHTVVTNAAGRFELPGLPVGQYLIGATAQGLEPFHERVTVLSGESVPLKVTLQIQALSVSMTAGRPGPAQTRIGRPPMPAGWICLDDVPRAGPDLCGPPSLVHELSSGAQAQLEALRNRRALPAFFSMTGAIPVRYPQDIWDALIEGSVVLEGRVGADGVPVGLVSTAPVYPGLAKAALESVSQWRFEPARLHGVAVESPLKVSINFRLHN